MSTPEEAWKAQVKAGFAALVNYAGVEAVFVSLDGFTYRQLVLFSEPTQVVGGMHLSDEHAIEYDPDLLPGLRYGSAITVKGEPYTVREPSKSEDGFTMRATLTKVSEA